MDELNSATDEYKCKYKYKKYYLINSAKCVPTYNVSLSVEHVRFKHSVLGESFVTCCNHTSQAVLIELKWQLKYYIYCNLKYE